MDKTPYQIPSHRRVENGLIMWFMCSQSGCEVIVGVRNSWSNISTSSSSNSSTQLRIVLR